MHGMDKRVSLATIMAALATVGAAACSKANAPSGATKDPAAAGPATPTTSAPAPPPPSPGAPSPDPAPGASDSLTASPSNKSSEAAPSARVPPRPQPTAVVKAVDAVDAGRAGPKPNANMSCGAGVCGAGMDKKKK